MHLATRIAFPGRSMRNWSSRGFSGKGAQRSLSVGGLALREGRGTAAQSFRDLVEIQVKIRLESGASRLVRDLHLWQLRGSPATLFTSVIFPSSAPGPTWASG